MLNFVLHIASLSSLSEIISDLINFITTFQVTQSLINTTLTVFLTKNLQNVVIFSNMREFSLVSDGEDNTQRIADQKDRYQSAKRSNMESHLENKAYLALKDSSYYLKISVFQSSCLAILTYGCES